MGTIQWVKNSHPNSGHHGDPMPALSGNTIADARAFHQSIPGYQPTPLRALPRLAEHLGVGGILLKDESYRFGLNAFKALGCSYAIGRYLSRRLDGSADPALPFSLLKLAATKGCGEEITFVTATDGNHGRGVAWAAQMLGHKAVVYLPKGASPARLQAILDLGAEAAITELNYDDAVRLAADQAERQGWVLIQDTAWDGYSEIPTWIMQGYGTIMAETVQQQKDMGYERPTHIFLQAGVGSFAASMVVAALSSHGDSRPKIVIVEPDQADCLYRSALAADGRPRNVTGDLATIMAGLACGEPNPIAWDILRDQADCFVSCPDDVAATGMRVLGNPLGEDPRVIAGESGAVTTGLVYSLMRSPKLEELRDQLELGPTSHILLISTEGDTDPVNYRRVVWDGSCPAKDSQ